MDGRQTGSVQFAPGGEPGKIAYGRWAEDDHHPKSCLGLVRPQTAAQV
jgi:hypothetical protein